MDQNRSNKQDILAALRSYTPADERERSSLQQTITWLDRNSILTYPANKSGHLTADCWLLSPDYSHVLLTLHHKFHRWVQLGGHMDAGETLIQAALRETHEESGIADVNLLSSDIFDLDVHRVDAYPGEPHYHYDVRFLARAGSWDYHISPESDELRWFTPEDVDTLAADDLNQINATLTRMTAKWKNFLIIYCAQ